MECCTCELIGSQFDRKKAAKKLKEFREKGPQKTTRLLVQSLLERGVSGLSLLDIGGGIGAIQHALLKAGVEKATNLEASSAYIEACREEAQREGHADRINHICGNFANMDDVPPADIVTLERVICCYPDMPGLVAQSCEKTKKFLGLVYPHEAWWVRLGMGFFYNLRYVLTRNPFRVFLHPTSEVKSLIASFGFEQLSFQKSGPWQIYIYGRV